VLVSLADQPEPKRFVKSASSWINL
jgi:hypothetical protein